MAKSRAAKPLPNNYVEISAGNTVYFRILINAEEAAYALQPTTTNTNHCRAIESALRRTDLASTVRGIYVRGASLNLPTPIQLSIIIPIIMAAMEKELRQPPSAIKNIHERPDARPRQFIATPSGTEITWRMC